jgi:benzylsuccinate CoA-transferase BbsE subunit
MVGESTQEIVMISPAPGPLHGLRVVDLSDALGAYTGRLLSDLGAVVTRIRHRRDTLDAWPRSRRLFLEAGKETLVAEPGTVPFAHAVDNADVLLTSAARSQLAELWLDPVNVRDRWPALIFVNISGYGLHGPAAERPHSDLTRLAAGGLLYLGGDPDREPVRPYPEQSSMAACLHATTATLIVLRQRTRTGAGAFIDTSAQEAVAHSVENAAQVLDLEGTVRRRAGSGPREAGTGLFRCSDGWMYLVTSIGGRRLRWNELVAWMSDEQTPSAESLFATKWNDPDFVHTPEAVAESRTIIEAFMATRTKRWLHEQGQQRGISIAPVSTPHDLLDNPQLAALNFFTTRTVDGNVIRFPGPPYRFSACTVGPRDTEGQPQ